MSERDPTAREVHQVAAEEVPDLIEVPVRVEGPIDARSLPAVAWTVNRFEITDSTGPIRLTGRNPFRKRLTIHSEDAGFFYGASQAQVSGRGNTGFLGMNIPLELAHTEEVWATNIAAESPKVTVVEEMWTR
jgi:hypothetical protein